MTWTTEATPLGRIVVPPAVPEGYALFYTTADFAGRLSPEVAALLKATVREHFAIEATLTTCTQVHGAAVRRAAREPEWRECDACDALWASGTGSALGIKVADCLPVTMIDSTHEVIVNIHSGWRGALQNITAETLAAVCRDSAFSPQRAIAWLGPSIRVCCFEVGEEVVGEFAARFPSFERFVDRRRGKPHIDLAALTADALQLAGLDPSRIHDSNLCTRCDGSIFHSYRRDRDAGGRNLAVVAH